MVKRICDNCTQKETCHLLLTIGADESLWDFFCGQVTGLSIIEESDLALACKFYEEDND